LVSLQKKSILPTKTRSNQKSLKCPTEILKLLKPQAAGKEKENKRKKIKEHIIER